MDPKQLQVKVDSEITFGVNTQLKEQLKWLIGTDQIQIGDMLPSAAQLADSLGLNRNTVNWVYTQLRDEGIVTMHKGRGTQVTGSAATEQLRHTRMPMRQLLDETVDRLHSSRLNAIDFFTAGLAFMLLRDNHPYRPVRLLFIECMAHDHPFYLKEIERATGAKARTVFLEHIRSGEITLEDDRLTADVVITTLNHADEVKSLMPTGDRRLIVIGASVEPSALLEMVQIKPGSLVSFVCLGKAGGEWMAHRVQEAGISHFQAQTLGVQASEGISDALSESDCIYASAAVYDELQSLAPDKVRLYPMRLEQSSVNLLHELVQP
ncbi:GntR family transcriptional regulator [Paenibacillus gorillae]|uniref:GntR family transcriptional regulator n=1 Tax=Paenibacillus gorillae TaxID=1243662 RepID=UPI0004B58032|nr:GntR family transcriptional regulator [Paenibacillus gorillae]